MWRFAMGLRCLAVLGLLWAISGCRPAAATGAPASGQVPATAPEPTPPAVPELLPPATGPARPTATVAQPAASPTRPVPTAGPPLLIHVRGDPARTGAYDYPAIRQLPGVKWQTDIGLTTESSPLFFDGVLYVGAQDGKLHALDGETGETLWASGAFGGHLSPIAIAGDVVYVGGLNGAVNARHRQTGQRIWLFNASGSVWGAPLVVEDTVFVVSERATHALDAQTGQARWQFDTGPHRGFVASPAYDAGLLYAAVGPNLFAFEAETGQVRWQLNRQTWFYPPAVSGGSLYVGNEDGLFHALDAQTGAARWSFPGGGPAWSAPAIDGGLLYVGNIDHNIYALDTATGQLRWQFEAEDWAVSDPLFSDGVLYVGSGNHDRREGPRHLYALDAATGTELWKFLASARVLTAPALAEGKIYVVGFTGDVYALEPPAR
jgi:outer membrane protein assembly factor BamB